MAESPTVDEQPATFFSKTVRVFGWSVLAVMVVFLVNNFLSHGAGWPGAGAPLDGETTASGLVQLLLYPLAIVAALVLVMQTRAMSLRADGKRIARINTFLIRAAFWCVLIVGVGDAIVSFMRIEGLLEAYFGKELTSQLGRSQFRGIYFHMPLLALGVIIACFTRTLGFPWLALLIVIAELGIVFMRFIFSYEQAFMADLVRFWYGALFLFASAYTLQEEGHVRVDVFYAAFKDRTKAVVNAVGTLTMGLVFCWTILIVGMGQKTSIINSPVFNFEVTQAGFGMYVKYMMAAFLGIFAISMMIQFVSYLLEAIADYRGEPGHVDHEPVVQ
ncbi:TRAP transporter small permease subunit [Hoeflea prorocentri]|uniref:TRAP transporter small permease protein n=1 Tax=Hoeflea prorocentri TaxID=1922333 RepID=A0A9X3UJ82_9HYPH|nr:TRAP transporter small permease subunit [Hoeflea prorocentri]MCY6380134.1 TRAP transporter small permease subunit [Hoeflea prorocentri]MDA5397934.1 TRAP transporter small permease subunit [Hoeflea prorocentri]